MKHMKITKEETDLILKLRTEKTKEQKIKEMFSFYKAPIDPYLEFANGHWGIHRSEEFYNKLLDTLITALNKYEKWIKKSHMCTVYKNGFTRDNIKGYSWVGRFLDDSGSPLYYWWGIQANICPECFIEWGQMYYTNICNHKLIEK